MLEVAGASSRYEVLRRIGAGGMGVVYEAEDKERGQKVALKTIANPDVEKVYQLKREFRVLADISHPNLVALYDLVVDQESCFFTMELLNGVDLPQHLWDKTLPPQRADVGHAATQVTPHAIGTPVGGEDPTINSGSVATPCNIPRLRTALLQLARGLQALHTAGKI